MLSDKLNMTEAAYIGEELMKSSPLTDLDRKCIVVRQVVQEGDFSLEDALNLYQVSRTDFENFIAKYLIAVLKSSFDSISSDKFKMLVSIEVIAEMYKQLFTKIDKDAPSILDHMDALSKDVNEGKIAV